MVFYVVLKLGMHEIVLCYSKYNPVSVVSLVISSWSSLSFSLAVCICRAPWVRHSIHQRCPVIFSVHILSCSFRDRVHAIEICHSPVK